MDNSTLDKRTRANRQLDYDERTNKCNRATNGLDERTVEPVRMAEIFLDFDDIVGYKNLALSD